MFQLGFQMVAPFGFSSQSKKKENITKGKISYIMNTPKFKTDLTIHYWMLMINPLDGNRFNIPSNEKKENVR